MKPRLMSLLAAAAVVTFTSPALAADVTGTIASLRISASEGATPAHLQLKLTGSPNLCSSATSREYAYLELSDSQFERLVAIATAAKLSGKTVVVASNSQNGTGFYQARCQLKSITLID